MFVKFSNYIILVSESSLDRVTLNTTSVT